MFTLDRWWSRSEGELVYSGDDDTVEPSGASRQRGWETTLFVRPIRWRSVDPRSDRRAWTKRPNPAPVWWTPKKGQRRVAPIAAAMPQTCGITDQL